MTPANAAMLTQLLAQLESRANADAAAFLAYQGLVDRRFESAHEDRRRDFRDLMGELRDVRVEFAKRFDHVDTRMATLCDESGTQHQEIEDRLGARIDATDDDVLELRQAIEAAGNQALGRKQVTGQLLGGARFALSNPWLIVVVLMLAADYVPRLGPIASTIAEAVTGNNAQAAPLAIRGGSH